MQEHVRKVLQGFIEDGLPGASEFLGVNCDDEQVTIDDVQSYLDDCK